MSMTGVEAVAAEGVLITALKAANVASGKVYSRLAPSNTTPPYVIVQVQSQGSGVLRSIGGGEVWTDPQLVVKAVAPTGSWPALTAIVKAAHAVIQEFTGAVADANIVSCIRESTFDFVETVQGTQYRHLGNAYRLLVQ